MLYAMEPAEADWYTWHGYILGVVGVLLSVLGVLVSSVGLAATYYQVRAARKSADAARDAAQATAKESQDSFNRYLAATVHRQLAEIEGFATDQNWASARLRCDNMASILAQLAEADMADEYRVFAAVFRDMPPNKRKPFDKPKWNELIRLTKRRVDLLTAPFDITRKAT